jgi:hypothetical protein
MFQDLLEHKQMVKMVLILYLVALHQPVAEAVVVIHTNNHKMVKQEAQAAAAHLI